MRLRRTTQSKCRSIAGDAIGRLLAVAFAELSLGSAQSLRARHLRGAGRPWWDVASMFVETLALALTITFAEVATHNHFVLDRGGKVFKQTAPVIKLPAGGSEDEHLGLLGLLNSRWRASG